MSPITEAPAKGANLKASKAKMSNGHQRNGRQETVQSPNARPEKQKDKQDSHWIIVSLPVERIEPSPYQPRLSFDAEEMSDLVASVRAKGVQQPIIVRTGKSDREALQNGAAHTTKDEAKKNEKSNANGQVNGKTNGTLKSVIDGAVKETVVNPDVAISNVVRYELIAGERRLRACKEAGRKTIPAIVRDDLTDAECAELALLENVQRSNLSVIEEARGYKRLMLQFRMKEERIAKKVGKSAQTIRDMMKLLQLPEPVQSLLARKKLTASHGYELLSLAPFERLCVLVAEKAARDGLTATSLHTTPLPNLPDLKRLGLVAELDWRTKFDWKNTCGQCPHKAYVTSGYGSYCLKPEEWNMKQQAATLQQKQEAAQVLEEARQQNGQPVEADKLTPGSYRNLSHSAPPAGCSESCPCRSEAVDPHDPTRKYPVCLDPSRLNELTRAEREANEEARREQYLALWQRAKESLSADAENRILARVATLIALPVLQAEFCRYVDRDQWLNLARGVSGSVGFYVPWDELFDDEAEKDDRELYVLLHRHLETQPPEKLLLLCACLLSAYEASQVVRFGGETPGIDFVLGRTPATQPELDEQEPDEGFEQREGETETQ